MPKTAEAIPDLVTIIGATIAGRTEFDSVKRGAILGTLARLMNGPNAGSDSYETALPPMIARSLMPFMGGQPTAIERTAVGYQSSGPGGMGATLKVGMAPDVFDRQRTTFGPVDLVNWWETDTRQWQFPTVQETSRATGKRWGGIQATWGLGETVLPAATDAAVSQCNFVNNRLLIYTTVSRDVWSDARKLERWVSYVALSEVRASLELAIITGILGGPQGIVNAPCVVVVPKGATSGSSISSANIDAMWAAIAAGNRRNAAWFCSTDTFDNIDQLAVSGQFPEINYIPAGMYGNTYATMKGRPIIPCEACPVIGTPGDLICADLTDYVFTYLQPKPGASALSFSVDIPMDKGHTGIRGLPEGVVEQRASDQALFSTDQLALVWKLRGDGRFLWNTTMTNISGGTVGPAAIIAQR